jgi:hypothetical protein
MQDNQQTPIQTLTERRLLILTIGGSAGLLVWILSLVLAYRWRGTIFGGLDAWQGANWWQLWVCLLAMFGGLAIMFVSLLPLRAVAHANAALRRLLYGYNAVLTGLLLLAILMVGNVLVYNYLTPSFDWTQSGIYTLSDRSKNLLRSLDQPAKVYAVLVSSGDVRMREVRTLLDNCRAVNEKLQVEYVDPDLDRAKMIKLMNDYQWPIDQRQGLLVVYGQEGKADHQLVKDSDLFAADPASRENRFIFKGEDGLMTALSYLEEGKSRPVVYFTQGNGEPDLNDANSPEEGRGLGALRERLQKGNYQIKGLKFGPVANVKSKDPLVVISDRVPDDAETVVVAGPRMALPEYALKALRDYMSPPADKSGKKKGKLIVMLDLVMTPAKEEVKTGLESLLAEFDVKVGDNRVLGYKPTDPFRIPILGNFGSRNPVARTFSTLPVIVANARTIEPQRRNPNIPGGSQYIAEPILLTPSNAAWVDTNLRADPGQLVTDLRQNRQELEKALDQDPTSIVVAVGESKPPAGNDPHAFMRPPEQTPRLVVFGSASFATNPYMSESGGQLNYDLFSSALAWLRERPSSIGLEPKKRNIFVLNVRDEVVSRMRWLPMTFMVIAIIGMGTGVWLIRRR